MTRRAVLLALVCCAAACGTDNKTEAPIFAADYASSYTEVRNCRPSVEHGPVNIRVLAAPDALTTYTTHNGPFTTGAILLKEEYPEADTACAGPIKQWTVMEKLDDGSATAMLDWHWQKVDKSRKPIMVDDPTCIACHKMCQAPQGYLNTCTLP